MTRVNIFVSVRKLINILINHKELFFMKDLSQTFFSNLNTILLLQQCVYIFFPSSCSPLSMIDSQVTTSGTLHVYNTKYNWTRPASTGSSPGPQLVHIPHVPLCVPCVYFTTIK